MKKNKLIKTFFIGTFLSILVFFSVSFITILTQLNPIHYYQTSESYKLDIGFPFKYYGQFWLSGSNIPNSSWNINNLFYDCLLTWIVVVGLYYLILRTRTTATNRGLAQ
jgi:hypothetical protein